MKQQQLLMKRRGRMNSTLRFCWVERCWSNEFDPTVSLGGAKFEAGFGYRYLTWRDTDKAIQDLTVKGPYAGVRFLF